MNSTVVVYKSKYGSTRKYAEWIASELKAELYEAKEVSAAELEKYSTVIFGGGLYINKLNGIGFIQKNRRVLSNKKMVVFTCGLSGPENERSIERIKNALFKKIPDDIKENVKLFHLRGGITYSKLNFFDGLFMKMLAKIANASNAGELPAEQQEIVRLLGKDFDFIDREKINPLVGYIRNSTIPA